MKTHSDLSSKQWSNSQFACSRNLQCFSHGKTSLQNRLAFSTSKKVIAINFLTFSSNPSFITSKHSY